MMPETYYDGNNEINAAAYSWLAGGSKPYLSIIGDRSMYMWCYK